MKIKFVIFFILFQLANIFEMGAQSYWQKTYDIPASNNEPKFTAMQILDDNSVIIFGIDNYIMTQKFDLIITRLDSAGNQMFAKKIIIPGYNIPLVLNVLRDGNNLYVSLYIISTSISAKSEQGVAKFDTWGNLIWIRKIKDLQQHFQPQDIGFGFNTNQIVVVGSTHNDGIDSTYYPVLVVLDTSGNITHSFISNQNALGNGFVIIDNAHAALVINHLYKDSLGNERYAGIIKIDSGWNVVSHLVLKDTSGLLIHGNASKFANNKFAFTGSILKKSNMKSKPFLLELDANLNVTHYANYSTPNYYSGEKIINLDTGGYAFMADLILFMIDTNGTCVKAERYINQSGQTDLYDFHFDAHKQLHLVGQSGQWFFDAEAYYVKTDTMLNSGCFQQSLNFATTYESLITAYIPSALSPYNISLDSTYSTGQITLVDTNWCYNTVSMAQDYYHGSHFTISPNPATNELFILNNSRYTQFKIYDLTGRIYRYITCTQNTNNAIDISDLPPGIYLITTHDIKLNFKFIKI
ncbi:MAG: T9SS type A sorting domain-containing protein [Bacteroidetes bacterium]|nr:T9SS type A sorting domain-containing protein [Bacteroidota bacterium]